MEMEGGAGFVGLPVVRITCAQNRAEPKQGHSRGRSELLPRLGAAVGLQSDLFLSPAGAPARVLPICTQ